jgi:hypothetical protein
MYSPFAIERLHVEMERSAMLIEDLRAMRDEMRVQKISRRTNDRGREPFDWWKCPEVDDTEPE